MTDDAEVPFVVGPADGQAPVAGLDAPPTGWARRRGTLRERPRWDAAEGESRDWPRLYRYDPTARQTDREGHA